jgi:hypothetical protein
MTASRVYPTPSTTTYYMVSSSDGKEYRIADMFRVDFQRRASKQPIYGYNSTQFDFVAKGKELVTGNLVINFRYPGYLYNYLAVAMAENARSEALTSKALYNKPGIFDFNPSAPDTFATIESMENNEDKMNALANLLVHQQTDTDPHQYFSSLGASFKDPVAWKGDTVDMQDVALGTQMQLAMMIKDMYKNKFSRGGIERGGRAFSSTEGTGLDAESPLSRSGKFDIVVKYGHKHATMPGDVSTSFQRKFSECYLVGEEETVSASAGVGNDLSSSAQPILEIYPFFCKTITTESYRDPI